MAAKTRLLQSDRDAIRAAVIAHKFDPINAALDAEEYKLAEEVRKTAIGNYLPTVEKAPEGAYPERTHIEVNVGGPRILLNFGKTLYRRVFHAHQNSSGRIAMTADSELGARVLSWADRREAAKRDREKLGRVTDGTLAQFRSFDDLLAAWPEAERFITARWRTRPDYIANVPMIQLKELAANLDLPPEELEAA